MMKTIVIALGGNAILKKGEEPTIPPQIKNIRKACESLYNIIKDNRVVITHGNGPQAGYLLMQQNAPLDIIDAETEGQIGYLIEQELFNLFRKNKKKRSFATLLTQVIVDKKDKAFNDPDKFVGQFYTKEEAIKLKNKFTIKEDIGRGYRRVVPSPKPKEIIENKIIKKMLNEGIILIAAGGGGIPVINNNHNLEGIEAVIDKDLASACLAHSINADELIIVTDIDYVYINYKKPNQERLTNIKLKDLKNYFMEEHFHKGSMGPKIEAAINFLENGGKKVIITDITSIGKRGTIITR